MTVEKSAFNLATAEAKLPDDSRLEGLEQDCRNFLHDYPDDGEISFSLGTLIMQRAQNGDERVEAIEWFERSLEAPELCRQTKANALNNIGLICWGVPQSRNLAQGCFARALLIDDGCIAARTNFAISLLDDGRHREAEEELLKVLAEEPNSPDARMARGGVALMLGDFESGWADYEARFQAPCFPPLPELPDRPLWRGESLDHRTILLVQEQGFGDAFMCIRYAREIKRLWPTAHVIFQGHELILELFRGADGVDQCCTNAFDVGDYNYYCPLFSLPHRFGTTEATIPAAPYIRNLGWKRFDLRERECYDRRIGIIWAGSPRHSRDDKRSIPVELFQQLIIDNSDCHFFSLQVGPREHEASKLDRIIDLAPRIFGWESTAQALDQLDLLITVDTGTAHLAGALGRPVWTLLPISPDFRWQLNREDSPWYASMRLFRQTTPGDWESVIQRVSDALKGIPCQTV